MNHSFNAAQPKLHAGGRDGRESGSLDALLPSAIRRHESVVLVHGLAASKLVMRPLERHLASLGYQTWNWGYPSIWRGIEAHSRSLARKLDRWESRDDIQHVHFVTHSMGGILLRHLIRQRRPQKLGRVVMLSPPNHGSHVASRLAPVLGLICRPLHELSDSADSFVNRLPEPTDIDLGIVAAAHDRVVAAGTTALASQKDHVTVGAGHTSLLFRSEVAQLVERFLAHGSFTQTTPC